MRRLLLFRIKLDFQDQDQHHSMLILCHIYNMICNISDNKSLVERKIEVLR